MYIADLIGALLVQVHKSLPRAESDFHERPATGLWHVMLQRRLSFQHWLLVISVQSQYPSIKHHKPLIKSVVAQTVCGQTLIDILYRCFKNYFNLLWVPTVHRQPVMKN